MINATSAAGLGAFQESPLVWLLPRIDVDKALASQRGLAWAPELDQGRRGRGR